MSTTRTEILGIDVGNTIIDRSLPSPAPFPDALRVIERLVKEIFSAEHTYIVSRANRRQRIDVRRWLAESNFHELTGVPKDHVVFCAERKEKGPICDKLDVTHFIDDRPEVFFHMPWVPNRILHRAIRADVKRFRYGLRGVIRVQSWLEIEELWLP